MNTKVDGGPFFDKDNPDTWDQYFDWREDEYQVWPHGLEIFPNLQGRYLHIVGDLSSTNVNPSNPELPRLTFCTVIVTGTRYVRKDEVNSSLSINQGESLTFSLTHIESELTIANQLSIDVRQKDTHYLAFVRIERFDSKVDITIDATNQEFGDYELVLESFDNESNV